MVKVTEQKATEPGALDGFMVECERCGLVIKLSILPLANQSAQEHRAWHEGRNK